MQKRIQALCYMLSLFFLVTLCACDASSKAVNDEDYDGFTVNGGSKNSSGNEGSSSSFITSSESVTDSLDFVTIPAQTFTRVNTEVSVSSFAILSIEVTQALYAKFMKLPEQKIYGDLYPVANVTWYEAALFCNAMSKSYGLDTAYSYSSVGIKNVLMDLEENTTVHAIRLPTEAEWEVAVRAQTSTKYYWGNASATSYANYLASGSSSVTTVASFLPNGYGLYDMSGNVSEWVNDWYSAYPDTEYLTDPTGPIAENAVTKVHRGGSYASSVSDLASSERNYAVPSVSSLQRGFRVVLK